MVIVIAVVLGLAAAFIAGRSWTRNIEMMIPSVVVSCLILLGGSSQPLTHTRPLGRSAGYLSS